MKNLRLNYLYGKPYNVLHLSQFRKAFILNYLADFASAPIIIVLSDVHVLGFDATANTQGTQSGEIKVMSTLTGSWNRLRLWRDGSLLLVELKIISNNVSRVCINRLL